MFCPFTEVEVDGKLIQGPPYIYQHYLTVINGKSYHFFINEIFELEKNEYFLETRHIFKGLQLNLKWPKSQEIYIHNETDLRRIITESGAPVSPKEKLEHLFLYVLDSQLHDGQRMDYGLLFNEKSHGHFYLRSGSEIDFYMNTLSAQGYLNKFGGDRGPSSFEITYEGLQYGIQLREEGKLSNNCFIAMSFNPNMLPIRDAIKSVCIENGFSPILIDEQKIDFDQTINDAIIVNIKKSKFCIADFTQQKNGVYFESGYALGRGLPVIYLCSSEDFNNLHFDTSHFPQIKYDSIALLIKLLDDRIKAWII